MAHGIMLVGCGTMARVHCEALSQMPQVRLVSAVDLDPTKAGQYQQLYGFERTATDYRAELERDDFDIVLLCTHWWHRAEMMRACFEAGRHVLAEKPLSVYPDEVDQIIAAANAHGRKMRVGMMERFRPMFLKIVELLGQGEIGRPMVYNFIHHQCHIGEAAWASKKALMRGGVTPNIDCGIHKCDLTRLFSGADPVSVRSWGKKLEADSPADNYTHSVFDMSDGSVLTLEDVYSGNTEPMIYMWMLGPAGRILFEYCGSHARPTLRSIEDVIRVWHRDPPHTATLHTPLGLKPVGPQMAAFIEEIDQDQDLSWHYDNVRVATEMVIGATLSEARGQAVGFPLTDADKQQARELISRG